MLTRSAEPQPALIRRPHLLASQQLPVDHQIPNQFDKRGFSASLVLSDGHTSSLAVTYSGAGTYEVRVTPPVHGLFIVELLHGLQLPRRMDRGSTWSPKVYSVAGNASCPVGRLPTAAGSCGCPTGLLLDEGTGLCVACPPFTSSAVGAASCDVCTDGRILSPGHVTSTQNCLPCPLGGICGWNTTVQNLRVAAGYWRLSPYTSRLYQCEVTGNTTACLGGNSGEETCAARHFGPLCKGELAHL
jgi:hypothetical protein